VVKSDQINYRIDEEYSQYSEMVSAVFELSPDSISLTKVSNGEIIDCNPEYLNQIGYSREEVIGHTSLELKLFNFKERQIFINEIRKKQAISDYEIKIKRKDNVFINVLYSARFITINGIETILSIGKDITERKKVEQQLKNNADLLDQLYDAVIRTDANFKINYWNKAAEKMFGYSQDEALGINSAELLRPVYVPGERETKSEELNQNGVLKTINKFKHKNGAEIIVEQNATRINDNSRVPIGYIVIYRDITEQKKGEQLKQKLLDHEQQLTEELQVTNEELINQGHDLLQINKTVKESEERFHTLADNIPNLAWMADPDGWIFWYNNQWYDYTGTTLDDMQGWGWQKVHHPDYVKSVTEDWSTKIKEGKPYDNIFPLKGKDGSFRWFLTRITPIRDEQGTLTRWFGTNTDITERINREEELESTMEELKYSNKELEQFAYITSHDLREPLRMITSFLQLLERRYKDQLDKDANEFIAYAVDGAKRLDAMTNDLLHYSKITNEKREIIPVNFEHVLEHTLTNLKVQIEENNAIITHDPLPTIKGDEQLKIQLFQNIIGNAIKYRSQKTPKIHISATKEGNQYLFSIKDNGIGMSNKHLEKIFTIFQRLHTHEEYDGTGIGLAIAQKIVNQQGGQIWAESILGKGTTFYFTILIN
jgi:PAS domain S-box-containing protein